MIPANIKTDLAAHIAAHPKHFMAKFGQIPDFWLDEARAAMRRFGLDSPPRQRVLDIGSGYGYFLLACRTFGHEATGIDLPDPVIQEAAAILDAEYIPHRITRTAPLPEGLGTFDTVTMMGVNLREADRWWGHVEYNMLWRAVAEHLSPDGRWIIQPNRGERTDALFKESFWKIVTAGAETIRMHNGWVEVVRHD